MGYREVTMLEAREILRLWLGGVGKKRIARLLGLDPKTVRRYIAAAHEAGVRLGQDGLDDATLAVVLSHVHAPSGRPHGDSWELCSQHADAIRRGLRQRLRLSKIQRLLERDGIVIPYATLHRYAVSELGFGRGATTILVADCGPGEELQVDTAWLGWLEPDGNGKRRRFRAWIFTSVYSRHRFVYAVFQETTETAIEACEAAWEFFGGIFKVLLPDNTKAIVNTADPTEPVITRGFLEYAQERGFHIDPTRAGHAQDKARVERAVRSVRDDCFAGERLHSLDEARERARSWCMREYGMRRQTRTQRLPLEHFDRDEKPRLRPAPLEPYDIPHRADPKVARDQHAQVLKALYSLPTRFVGKRLHARADRNTVRFYHGVTLVKTHPRQPPGGRSTDPSDYPAEKTAYAMRDVTFLVEQARARGRHVGEYAEALLAVPLPWTRMRRVYALLGLARRYGDARLDEACKTALEVDMLSIKRLERMLKLAQPQSTPSSKTRIVPIARYLRPKSQFALTHHDPGQGDDS